MGRRLFLTHLSEATSFSIPQVVEQIHSPEEGIVSCAYTNAADGGHVHDAIQIHFCATNIDEYPEGNTYVIYTDDENAGALVPVTLKALSGQTAGKPLVEAIRIMAHALNHTLASGTRADLPIDLDASAEDEEDEFDFEYNSDGDSIDLGILANEHDNRGPSEPLRSPISKCKLTTDLRAAKDAGFRVGILGDLMADDISFLCVSIRIGKLGLSEEAMQAWEVDRTQYLVLLVRFTEGYRDIQSVKDETVLNSHTEIRVCLCSQYKPSFEDAVLTFKQSTTGRKSSGVEAMQMQSSSVKQLFIGKALNQLFRERFSYIIAARDKHGLTWLGAEKYVSARFASALASNLEVYHSCDDSAQAQNLPALVTADHLAATAPSIKHASLPLVAMQFLLRRFVRCTEFCLVCYNRVDEVTDALKPYVCGKPLCLYQYMSLGFGPSVEWEILSQPYVVDLLISFCYTAAATGNLKVTPVGMNLTVPCLPAYNGRLTTGAAYFRAPPKPPAPEPHVDIQKAFSAQWKDVSSKSAPEQSAELVVHAGDVQTARNVRVGDWIAITRHGTGTISHCRVTKVALPILKLTLPSCSKVKAQPANPGAPNLSRSDSKLVDCYLYDTNFDSLPKNAQQHAICTLLDLLPSVEELHKLLETQPNIENAGGDRVPVVALSLLRWIIASNRSCIIQVDDFKNPNLPNTTSRRMDRVGELDNYVQFRFAQGAPDKEKRFTDAVNREAAVTNTAHPTLFAWHGSPLYCWHGIIREGLQYDSVLHGRSFGNGVYMSPYAGTSKGYSGSVGTANAQAEYMWPQTILNPAIAFSLNEVVNNPSAFVSSSPHYVVSNIDWIQTRYLLVSCPSFTSSDVYPTMVYKQDPKHRAFNEQNKPINIPISAISKTRRPSTAVRMIKRANGKRFKSVQVSTEDDAEVSMDDGESIVSDDDDLQALRWNPSDGSNEASLVAGPAQTDFVPSKLDFSGIKFLKPPRDDNPVSSRALMRLLQEALEVQKKTPAHQLGWTIDPEVTENLYQWIVQLHSFPSNIPLKKDMKMAGVTSIVLEMRFSTQFPYSPPFVRVVKPRFLPFAHGGGGNVTEGGAMCLEVLTNNGWSALQTVENLLLQIRVALCDEERPARLMPCMPGGRQHRAAYGIGEAVTAYLRACRTHNWQVPVGFETLQEEGEYRKGET